MQNQQNDKSSYFPVYHDLLRASHIKSIVDGTYHKFPDGQKLIFHYVLDRYKFFKQQGKPYFDNQEDIAIACSCVRRTVFSMFKLLEECGYLQIKGKMVSNHRSNSYEFTDELILAVFQSKKITEEYKTNIIFSYKTEAKAKVKIPNKKVDHRPTWCEEDSPF